MKQPNEGFYMGIRKMSEDGQMISFENTYGLARTAFIWTAYLVGGLVLMNTGVKIGKRAINAAKVQINEYKMKKKLESK